MAMIKVSAFYPYSEGCRFDFDYYRRHMARVRKKLGAACKGIGIERGVDGFDPGTPPAFVATAHVLCDSVDTFRSIMAPHMAELLADVSNYTDVQPIIQFSDVKM
jgi:uncharacterized protein (TIGR02118 family)